MFVGVHDRAFQYLFLNSYTVISANSLIVLVKSFSSFLYIFSQLYCSPGYYKAMNINQNIFSRFLLFRSLQEYCYRTCFVLIDFVSFSFNFYYRIFILTIAGTFFTNLCLKHYVNHNNNCPAYLSLSYT